MMRLCHSNETWKDIPQYEGLYQASTFGRIRTVEGRATYSRRSGERHWKSRIMKGRGDNCHTGKRVSLWKDGKPKDFLVARLVAMTFLGEPPEKFTVNHKDGNRMNNHIENLEWLSLADNIRHGFENCLYSTQKQVSVTRNGKTYRFRAMAQLDVFLKRCNGYTSGRIKKNHTTVIDADGLQYQIILKG